MNRLIALAAPLLLALPCVTEAQGGYNPAAAMAAQREAMVALAAMDGVWRGPAWTVLPSGERHTLTQTERIGPSNHGIAALLSTLSPQPRWASSSPGKVRITPVDEVFAK